LGVLCVQTLPSSLRRWPWPQKVMSST